MTCVAERRGLANAVGGMGGELSDLCCGRRRPPEYAALCSWRLTETCRLPGVRGKNTTPRPEVETKKKTFHHYISNPQIRLIWYTHVRTCIQYLNCLSCEGCGGAKPSYTHIHTHTYTSFKSSFTTYTYNECFIRIIQALWPEAKLCWGALTCRRNVIGFWPMAWASPMFALMTSLNGFLTPWKRGANIETEEKENVLCELAEQFETWDVSQHAQRQLNDTTDD